MISVCLVASSNYVINEILDAPYDRLHPVKKNAAGRTRVSQPSAGLFAVDLIDARWSRNWALCLQLFCLTVLVLWIMGCFYNIRPIRTKDVPYLDVLSESVNNPLRMLAGWYMVTDSLVPPVSLLICYWMIGAYFMGLKRFSELREIGDRAKAAAIGAPFITIRSALCWFRSCFTDLRPCSFLARFSSATASS